MVTPGGPSGPAQKTKGLRKTSSLSELIAAGLSQRQQKQDQLDASASTTEATMHSCHPAQTLESTNIKYIHRRWSSMGKKNEDMDSEFNFDRLNSNYIHEDAGSRFSLLALKVEQKLRQFIPLSLEGKQDYLDATQGTTSPTEGSNRNTERRVEVNVVKVIEDSDEEDDEAIWTTPEWLEMRDYTERIRVEMTQNSPKSNQDTKGDGAGHYTYRVNYGFDGADDESFNTRFGRRTFRKFYTSSSIQKNLTVILQLQENPWPHTTQKKKVIGV